MRILRPLWRYQRQGAICGPRGPRLAAVSPQLRQQQVPMPHGRGWVSTPAECREPRAASRPRPDSPGRKMGAPWELYRAIASRRVQSAYLPARKFGRGGPAKGHPPPHSRRDAEGPVCGRQSAAGISHPAAAGANSGGPHQREENRMKQFIVALDVIKVVLSAALLVYVVYTLKK